MRREPTGQTFQWRCPRRRTGAGTGTLARPTNRFGACSAGPHGWRFAGNTVLATTRAQWIGSRLSLDQRLDQLAVEVGDIRHHPPPDLIALAERRFVRPDSADIF